MGDEAITPAVELLPCPFCAGPAKLVTTKRRIGSVTPHMVIRQHVECKKCGAQSKVFKGTGKAMPAWNRRA